MTPEQIVEKQVDEVTAILSASNREVLGKLDWMELIRFIWKENFTRIFFSLLNLIAATGFFLYGWVVGLSSIKLIVLFSFIPLLLYFFIHKLRSLSELYILKKVLETIEVMAKNLEKS